MNIIRVFFENSVYSYATSVSVNCDVKSATDYFLNSVFDVGTYPIENQQKCVGFWLTDKENQNDHFVGNCSVENVAKFENGLITYELLTDQKAFNVSFIGRDVGAIGRVYSCNYNVFAVDRDHTILKLYDKYEHISETKVIQLVEKYGVLFTLIGDLVSDIEYMPIWKLKDIHDKLTAEGDHISATRIQHQINVKELFI